MGSYYSTWSFVYKQESPLISFSVPTHIQHGPHDHNLQALDI